MTLLHYERCLKGGVEKTNGTLSPDAVSIRIAHEIENLQLLVRDASGWDALYLDKDDGRLWELTYPDSHQHGGGAPMLATIDPVEAKKKYGSSEL